MPGARSGDRFARDDVSGNRVAAVERDTGEAVGGGALRYVLDRVLLAKWGGDRKPVVLAHKDLGQLVDRGKVERLMSVTLGASALAVAGEQHLVGAVHLQCVRHTCAAHHLGGHRRTTGRNVVARIGKVAWGLLAS